MDSIKQNTIEAGREEADKELEIYNQMVKDYNNSLGKEFQNSGKTLGDILKNPSDLYYEDAVKVAQEKKDAIKKQKDKVESLKTKYYSLDDNAKAALGDEERKDYEGKLSEYSNMQNSDFTKEVFAEAANLLRIGLKGVDEYEDGDITYVKRTTEQVSDSDWKEQFTDALDHMYVYDETENKWKHERDLSKIKTGQFVLNDDYDNYMAYKGTDGKFYWVQTGRAKNGALGSLGRVNSTADYIANTAGILYANGTYSSTEGTHLINELGTEAIVTPQGTLTALPSHSGIVPADLTRNLFNLGEIAPNLIATLRNQMPNVSKSNSTNNDNSTNIGTVYATFNADSGFDMNRFMIDLRSAAGNTRHNN